MPVIAVRKHPTGGDGQPVANIYAERAADGTWQALVVDPFPGRQGPWRFTLPDEATVDTVLQQAADRRGAAVDNIQTEIGAFRQLMRDNGGT
jgi:hypothetical protein